MVLQASQGPQDPLVLLVLPEPMGSQVQRDQTVRQVLLVLQGRRALQGPRVLLVPPVPRGAREQTAAQALKVP